ncbi:MAG: hypothetical protein LC768_14865 [Acidobacteria bacterium]|nr:hypothetical protein [Acidobacteriota bacterium]MCA1639589.1 hypothetical protein [Acidobacteriota bacterium]
MKRFIITILCVSVFFIGLGGIIEQVEATFKSDERALVLLRQGRIAIGGEDRINSVKSLRIVGKSNRQIKHNGVNLENINGELEMDLLLPNQLRKIIKSDSTKALPNGTIQSAKHGEKNVLIVRSWNGQQVKMLEPGVNAEESTLDGKKVQVIRDKVFEQAGGNMRNNELLRTVLGLLLQTPTGFDVNYTFEGESTIDGVAANVIKVQGSGDYSNQLYLDKSTNLPVMMSYQCPNMLVLKINRGEDSNSTTFTKGDEKAEISQCQLRFTDYQSVDGLKLPHRWTVSRNGDTEETVSIDSYTINPLDISEKINSMPEDKGVKVLIRKSKKEQ